MEWNGEEGMEFLFGGKEKRVEYMMLFRLVFTSIDLSSKNFRLYVSENIASNRLKNKDGRGMINTKARAATAMLMTSDHTLASLTLTPWPPSQTPSDTHPLPLHLGA